jgi:quinolinate synthase
LEFEGRPDDNRIILWDGFCGVHQQFSLQNIIDAREKDPQVQIVVHPECKFEVVQAADFSGSTNKILSIVRDAPDSARFAIGTDNNLVGRIINEFKGRKKVSFLNFYSCSCATMNRIRLPHLAWNLDNILQGKPTQKITVDERITRSALKSLNKMLELTGQ